MQNIQNFYQSKPRASTQAPIMQHYRRLARPCLPPFYIMRALCKILFFLNFSIMEQALVKKLAKKKRRKFFAKRLGVVLFSVNDKTISNRLFWHYFFYIPPPTRAGKKTCQARGLQILKQAPCLSCFLQAHPVRPPGGSLKTQKKEKGVPLKKKRIFLTSKKVKGL